MKVVNLDSPPHETWGKHSLALSLPTVCTRISGLSLAQVDALKNDYGGFINNSSDTCIEPAIECQAYHLNSAPKGNFSRYQNGEYLFNPTLTSHADRVELSCQSYVASIPLDTNVHGTIGVLEERTLVEGRAVENFLRIRIAHKALEQKGLMLHSAGLVYGGQAYIFTGHSNAGKTTLTRKAFRKGACVLSDDINLITPTKAGRYQAHAVPFTGEFGRTLDHEGSRDAYPLAGIILLEQSNTLKTEAVRTSQAFAAMLAGCPFVNTEAIRSAALFDAVDNVLSNTPVIRLLSRSDDPIENIMAAVKKQFSTHVSNL